MNDPEPFEVNVGYCIKGNSLRFDKPLDGGRSPYFAYTGDVTFSAPNCSGTPEQLSAKYTTNCSWYCGREACGETP